MNLLAALLIVRSAGDVASDRQEMVMLVHDFSFRPAGEVLAEITCALAGHDTANMGRKAAGSDAMARRMLHCHHMPHLSTGMMTEFAVSA